MKKLVKAFLLLMAILTVIYVSAVVYVYANANPNENASYKDVCYVAFKYKLENPDIKWYTPEELGIVEIKKITSYAFLIVVDRQKEPFLLQQEDPPTVFLYNDEFYVVSFRWVTILPEGPIEWEAPTGAALAAGWVFTGALLLKWRKEE